MKVHSASEYIQIIMLTGALRSDISLSSMQKARMRILHQCDLTTAATRRRRSGICHRIRSTPLIQSFPELEITPGGSQQEWSRDGEAKDV